jgi:hypothetical protein
MYQASSLLKEFSLVFYVSKSCNFDQTSYVEMKRERKRFRSPRKKKPDSRPLSAFSRILVQYRLNRHELLMLMKKRLIELFYTYHRTFLKQYDYVSKITIVINWKEYFPSRNSVSFLKEIGEILIITVNHYCINLLITHISSSMK